MYFGLDTQQSGLGRSRSIVPYWARLSAQSSAAILGSSQTQRKDPHAEEAIVTLQFLSAEWECAVLNDRLVTAPHTLAIDED